jgi:hypothetical protein
MKGWELYTWQGTDQTWFSLLTGTNRPKTAAEVFSGPRDTSGADGVAITVSSLEAVSGVLARLPAGEYVTLTALRYPADTLEPIAVPADVQSTLQGYATALQLHLQ